MRFAEELQPAHGNIDDLQVVHADDSLLALDKPAGLLSVPGRGPDKQDCLSTRVQRRWPQACVVHRLDMATSGLIVMALGAVMQRRLSSSFEQRQVDKRYLAWVRDPEARLWRDAPGWARIDLPIGADWPNRPRQKIDPERGRAALTRWRALEHRPDLGLTRLELQAVTGRSHQLRLHLASIGHPIVGDRLYGEALAPAGRQIDPGAPPGVVAGDPPPRLMLHAWRMTLPHPAHDQPLELNCDPPF